ncbi:N-acetylmuramic acid 6-phosphate etherase [candidate division KSB1 bacterium]|nr:MAG: N-acetylmuramic acid 6-phosphate etherase [candidate division KSB1 bacterium]
MDSKTIFNELQNLVTEGVNPKSKFIDTYSIEEILKLINEEDKTVPYAVEKEIPYIKKAVEIIISAFKNGGRLFYVGAGTSGRLGVLDASECPPTFGVSPGLVQGIIAGGRKALVESQEGAEDLKEKGAEDLIKRGFNYKDVLCGIAASRRTPYVIGAIEKAKELGAKTIYITCNPRKDIEMRVDVSICPIVGPEVIMGSTRMKAGTATKLILNMLTTTSMIKLGKVYGNLMVDLQMKSKKLEERSKRLVMMVTGVDYDTAYNTLLEAGGSVKTAIVMILAGVSRRVAEKRLRSCEGSVRNAIQVEINKNSE